VFDKKGRFSFVVEKIVWGGTDTLDNQTGLDGIIGIT
jgi:hypothetical protein